MSAVDRYGIDPRATKAAKSRVENTIAAGLNVATFQLTGRFDRDENGDVVHPFTEEELPDLFVTRSSPGVGFDLPVGVGGKTIRLNKEINGAVARYRRSLPTR